MVRLESIVGDHVCDIFKLQKLAKPVIPEAVRITVQNSMSGDYIM